MYFVEPAAAIHHAYFRPSPVAVTFTVAFAPSATFTLVGCFVIASGWIMLIATVFDFTLLPYASLTTQYSLRPARVASIVTE